MDYNNENICQECKIILKNLKNEVTTELNDLLEMLENLKTSFKLGNNMDIFEENILISTNEIVQSIGKSHTKLALNGFNKFSIEIMKNFPLKLLIQKTLFKRVVNNIISNSLKHT